MSERDDVKIFLGDELDNSLSRRSLLKRTALLGLSVPVVTGLLAACGEEAAVEDPAAVPDAESDEEPTVEPDAESDEEPTAEAGEKHGGSLRVLQPNDFVNMWPAFTTGPTLPAAYDWLVAFRYDGEEYQIEPMLAESWEIDEESVTFFLREDVEFHDGTKFDAEAVRWNFEQWRTHPQSLAVTAIPTVDEDNPADVIDEYTVRLNLTAPDGSLMIELSNERRDTGIASPAAWDEVDREEEGDSIIMREAVGTGPFVFEEWVSSSHVTVSRNENYWRTDDDGNALPYVDEIRFDWVSDDSVRLIEMRAGDADITEFIRGRDVSSVENEPHLQYIEDPAGGGTMHRFFFNAASGPFADNLDLRKAVQFGIDREAIAEVVGGGLGIPMTIDTLPGIIGYDESIPYYHYDPDKAREHREASNVPAGFEFRLTVIAREVDEQQSAMVKQMLAEIDLHVNIELIERAAWGDQVRRAGDFDMATQRTGARPDNAALWHLTWAPEGAAPYSRPDEPEIWDLLQRARQTVDDGERHKMYVELQTLMYEAAWWGNFWLQPVNFALHQRVQGWPTLFTSINHLEEVWLENR